MIRTTVLDPDRTGKDATDLEIGLRRQVVGQDEAIEQIARVYQIHRTGLSNQGRPIGNFLFLGPTGSGKTRVVEATAQALLGFGYYGYCSIQLSAGRQQRLAVLEGPAVILRVGDLHAVGMERL